MRCNDSLNTNTQYTTPIVGGQNTPAVGQEDTSRPRLTASVDGTSRARNASPETSAPGPCRQGLVKLIAAAPHGRVGDQGNADSVAKATGRAMIDKGLYEAKSISHETLELQGSDEQTRKIQLRTAYDKCLKQLRDGEYQKIIFILAGSDHGLASELGNLESHPGMITVSTSHKLSKDMLTADRLADITAFPVSESITPKERAHLDGKTRVVQVVGVAHNLTNEKLAELVAKYEANGYPSIPHINKNTVAIVVPGNVVDNNGVTRVLHKDDAIELACGIAEAELQARGLDGEQCDFILLGSPRTPPEIFQAILEALIDYRGRGPTVHAFPFQRDRLPSAYGPVIDAYKKAENPGRFYVPGDSATMISEVADHLPDTMVIYRPNTMDAPNQRHVDAMVEQGIAWLDHTRIRHREQNEASRKPIVPAARQIADAIIEKISDSAT